MSINKHLCQQMWPYLSQPSTKGPFVIRFCYEVTSFDVWGRGKIRNDCDFFVKLTFHYSMRKISTWKIRKVRKISISTQWEKSSPIHPMHIHKSNLLNNWIKLSPKLEIHWPSLYQQPNEIKSYYSCSRQLMISQICFFSQKFSSVVFM